MAATPPKTPPRGRPDRPDLSLTALAVLGLLTRGPTSGYDLVKLVRRSVAYVWSPARSQLYSELSRLVARGYAAQREVAQRTRPDKRIYRITEAGRAALQRWLASPEAEPDAVRSEALLKLFFGQLADRDTLVELISRYRWAAVERLARYREIEREIEGRPDRLFPYLVLRAGLVHERAHIRWTDEVLRRLKEEG